MMDRNNVRDVALAVFIRKRAGFIFVAFSVSGECGWHGRMLLGKLALTSFHVYLFRLFIFVCVLCHISGKILWLSPLK